ncbi:hypothetical protein NS381_15610 [Pantoea stewartii]|nr:hypothetical protein NS381_15610 [Pantoea stewartii]
MTITVSGKNVVKASFRPRAIGVEAGFAAESAQSPERTDVREDDEHCQRQKWRVSQLPPSGRRRRSKFYR